MQTFMNVVIWQKRYVYLLRCYLYGHQPSYPFQYPISIQSLVKSTIQLSVHLSVWFYTWLSVSSLSYPMVIFSVNLFGLFKTCTYIYCYNHFNVVKEKSLKRKKVVIAWEYVDSILNLQKSGLSFSNHEISW